MKDMSDSESTPENSGSDEVVKRLHGTQVLQLNKSDDSGEKRMSPWFRGRNSRNPARKMPKLANLIPTDAVRVQALSGWMPEEPVITPQTRVTAFGSCFAANISNYLGGRGYSVSSHDDSMSDAYVVRIGEAMMNSFVIRQQFEWAWENAAYDEGLWYTGDEAPLDYSEEVRLLTKSIFDETDVFILTFGLSEVWHDKESGDVFMRALPKSAFDPEKHGFKVSTIEENRANLDRIYELIRKHAPHAKVIYTLSPIPLAATFRPHACITSNAVSKSILRVAIDEVVRAHQDEGVLHYWPSYEIIKDVLPGCFKTDGRHVKEPVLKYIMTQFEHVWCKPREDEPFPHLDTEWVQALAEVGLVPPDFGHAVYQDNLARMSRILRNTERFHPDDEMDAGLRKLMEGYVERVSQTRAEEGKSADAE